MTKKPSALASALRSSGAAVAAAPEPELPAAPDPTAPRKRRGRTGRARKPSPCTSREDVRRQLKSMAAEEGRSMEDMVAEALNLLFVRYRRPELAPRKAGK